MPYAMAAMVYLALVPGRDVTCECDVYASRTKKNDLSLARWSVERDQRVGWVNLLKSELLITCSCFFFSSPLYTKPVVLESAWQQKRTVCQVCIPSELAHKPRILVLVGRPLQPSPFAHRQTLVLFPCAASLDPPSTVFCCLDCYTSYHHRLTSTVASATQPTLATTIL